MIEQEITMKQLRPFWRRVTVLPSPVDEAHRSSGMIVPITVDAGIARGVVVDVAEGWGGHGIGVGTVVYYFQTNAIQIGDLLVVDLEDVMAFEEAE